MSDGPIGALRGQIERCLDPALDPGARSMRLHDLRERLVSLVGVADRYIESTERLREAEASDQARDVLWARGHADVREALIDMGEEPEVLDDAGFVSHAELDRLREEGLLAEAAAGLRKAWSEPKPKPKPKAAKGKPDWQHYFTDEPATLVSADRLKPTRTDSEEHVARARQNLDAARAGGMKKRAPLDGVENGDGTVSVVDGNATLAALRDEGLSHLPVALRQGDAEDEARTRAAGETLERAASAEPAVTATVKAVVGELGGELAGLEQKLKPAESIKAKIARKQEAAPMTADVAAQKVPDALRYSAVFPDEVYADGVQRTLEALAAGGLAVTDTRNYWGGEDDYDGFHAILAGPGETRVEVQFHTPGSLELARGANARLYEQLRASRDPGERYQLWQEMVANAKKVQAPSATGSLGPPTAEGE